MSDTPATTGLRERVAAIPWNVAGQNTAPVGGCDEEWAVSEYRDAVLKELDAALAPDDGSGSQNGLRQVGDGYEVQTWVRHEPSGVVVLKDHPQLGGRYCTTDGGDWPCAIVRAALLATDTVVERNDSPEALASVALGRIKAIAAHFKDESKTGLRSSMQAVHEIAEHAYRPEDHGFYRVVPATTPVAAVSSSLDVAKHAAMTGDPEDAWEVVRQVLGPDRPHGYAAVDAGERCRDCGEVKVNRVHHVTRLGAYHPFLAHNADTDTGARRPRFDMDQDDSQEPPWTDTGGTGR